MKRFTHGLLLALFLIFGLAAFAPQQTRGIFLLSGVHDCCKDRGTGPYCERNGCWLVQNCDHDDDCLPN